MTLHDCTHILHFNKHKEGWLLHCPLYVPLWKITEIEGNARDLDIYTKITIKTE